MTLEVKNLSHAYGKNQVLNEVNFLEPMRGSLTALIGPNASRKSTLFKCIAGLITLRTGIMKLNEENLACLLKHECVKRVSFMPQSFLSNAALTVFEVVLLACKKLSGWSVSKKDLLLVSELLDRIGISHLANSYIGELSGGQCQLVSAAQTLVRNPQVFLFDEPTSALDLRRQLELLTLIVAETRAHNIISFVALHDLNLAVRFADNVLLMQ